jgi:hypothetical protein
VDIEGAEFSALVCLFVISFPIGGRIRVLQESLINAYRGRPLPFGQLQLEIHVWGEMTDFPRFFGWWEMLEEAGLRPFWTEVESLLLADG